MPDGRNSNGRFAPGNGGGPGRPRRDTEREYLEVLVGEVPLETWRKICQAAVQDALKGDAKARLWLANYLLGQASGISPSLRQIAKDELAGRDPDAPDYEKKLLLET